MLAFNLDGCRLFYVVRLEERVLRTLSQLVVGVGLVGLRMLGALVRVLVDLDRVSEVVLLVYNDFVVVVGLL